MSSLTFIEKEALEEILQMSGGYVLDFTDRNFYTFFLDTISVDISNDKYTKYGNSKAKRIRCFWELHDDKTVGYLLLGVMKYGKFKNLKSVIDKINIIEEIAYRLLGQNKSDKKILSEEEFLSIKYEEINLQGLPLETIFIDVMEYRIKELLLCLKMNASLSAIFHCGSILEGILLGVAQQNPRLFNTSIGAPQNKEGKVMPLYKWNLSSLIDVSTELGILTPDIKKFSHGLKDFRNYIHPFEQATSHFFPDEYTARICHQVLRAAIVRVKQYESRN